MMRLNGSCCLSAMVALVAFGCTTQDTRVTRASALSTDSITQALVADSIGNLAPTPAHTLRIYVSAVNCEMNQADARRINNIARVLSAQGLTTEVVFAGIQSDTARILQQAVTDLGLEVSARAIRTNELKSFDTIGGAHLPMALITKARQLKTMIAGETMPRTLSVVEASMSSAGTL